MHKIDDFQIGDKVYIRKDSPYRNKNAANPDSTVLGKVISIDIRDPRTALPDSAFNYTLRVEWSISCINVYRVEDLRNVSFEEREFERIVLGVNYEGSGSEMAKES